MESTALTKQKIVSELSRSPHGNLKEYLEVGLQAMRQEPEFCAHLIAWDALKGQVRDAKVALPVISLGAMPNDLLENSWAHIASLKPREFLRAYRFNGELRIPGRMRKFRRLVKLYLRNFEALGYWEGIALQHRAVLHELYSIVHLKPREVVGNALFRDLYTSDSIFMAVRELKNMTPTEAAGTILERKIPFLVAQAALGEKFKHPDILMALIKRMSPTELVTHTKDLTKWGIKTNPVLRAAFEEALSGVSKSKANILKTSRAASVTKDPTIKAKLEAVQEKQIDSIAVEGNWLVLADKSGSMSASIEAAKMISATLAKLVKGKVNLTFFDTMPMALDITGCSLDIIRKATQFITAAGSTSIGCGLMRMFEAKEEVDGIAIVSDGCENTAPLFWDVYQKYSDMIGKEVPVYLYHVEGTDYPHHYQDFINKRDVQVFELGHTPDYYSLPNLVATMRSNRYSLVDEIMATKLLSLSQVFKWILNTNEKEVKYVTA
jgi:hypothetical protein